MGELLGTLKTVTGVVVVFGNDVVEINSNPVTQAGNLGTSWIVGDLFNGRVITNHVCCCSLLLHRYVSD